MCIRDSGNTSAGTLPLCLWDFEDKFKKGDNLILTAFGAGFAWGDVYKRQHYGSLSRAVPSAYGCNCVVKVYNDVAQAFEIYKA